jgi:GrpB-like predicted nucleotidyltransferase (UPF0157 family)
LRAHFDVAAEYETLERRLAIEHRLDREAYTQARAASARFDALIY